MIKILHEKCILCAGCAAVCPKEALEVVGTRLAFYSEKCTNCKLCIKVCPAKAISPE